MTTRVRKTLEVLALLAVRVTHLDRHPSAAASTTFRSPRDYVALGDSYSSGGGAPTLPR